MNAISESAESRTGVSAPLKILIVRLGAMGDVIHAIPAVMALRHAFANAEMTWAIESRWVHLLEMYDLVDRIHRLDTREWRKGLWRSREAVLRSIRELRQQKYDISIDFQAAIKSSVIAALSGAPRRYGFSEAWEKPASLLYTYSVPAFRSHVVERSLELASAVARREGSILPDDLPHIMQRATYKGKELTVARRRFAILNPGAGWGAKQWPAERYAEVARALGEDGIPSFINHGPDERDLASKVARLSGGFALPLVATFSESIAYVHSAALFIGGDTGPMHLAALLQVPVVAIFGPTDPARTGPYGTRSVVLRDPASVTSHKRNRAPEAGLLNITTEQVLQAARELLAVEGARE